MQVRVAEIRDAGAIVTLINVAFRLAEGFLLDRDRIDLETVGGLYRKGTFLVAEDSSLCGCVYVEPRTSKRSYLGLLAVDPRLQRAGLGSQLMKAAEAHCAKSRQPLYGFANRKRTARTARLLSSARVR